MLDPGVDVNFLYLCKYMKSWQALFVPEACLFMASAAWLGLVITPTRNLNQFVKALDRIAVQEGGRFRGQRGRSSSRYRGGRAGLMTSGVAPLPSRSPACGVFEEHSTSYLLHPKPFDGIR